MLCGSLYGQRKHAKKLEKTLQQNIKFLVESKIHEHALQSFILQNFLLNIRMYGTHLQNPDKHRQNIYGCISFEFDRKY